MSAKDFSKDIPKFVLGYSFGSTISTRLAQQRPDFFQGLIVAVPFYDYFISIPEDLFAQITEQARTAPNTPAFLTMLPFSDESKEFIMYRMTDPLSYSLM